MMADVSFVSTWIARVSSQRSSWVVVGWGCVVAVAVMNRDLCNEVKLEYGASECDPASRMR